jgi:amino acid permease
VTNFAIHPLLPQVVDEYHEPKLDLWLYMLMLLLPLILINWVRNLKLLAPFSTFANVVTFVGLGITLYYVFDGMPSPSERRMTGHIVDFPLFIGTTLFALEAVGVVSRYNTTSYLSGLRQFSPYMGGMVAERPAIDSRQGQQFSLLHDV